jgi:hypothetical protein
MHEYETSATALCGTTGRVSTLKWNFIMVRLLSPSDFLGNNVLTIRPGENLKLPHRTTGQRVIISDF